METVFIQQFEALFGILFSDVVCIEDMGADTDDDGIYHYIHMSNDVYSFDTNEEIWLEKNAYKNDVLQRVNVNFLLHKDIANTLST